MLTAATGSSAGGVIVVVLASFAAAVFLVLSASWIMFRRDRGRGRSKAVGPIDAVPGVSVEDIDGPRHDEGNNQQ